MQEMLSSSIKVKKGNKLFPRNFKYYYRLFMEPKIGIY